MTTRAETRAQFEVLHRRRTEQGLTYKQLSSETGICDRKIGWWCRKLTAEEQSRQTAEPRSFVEVRSTTPTGTARTTVRIGLRGGRSLEIEGDVADDHLLHLVSLLESTC